MIEMEQETDRDFFGNRYFRGKDGKYYVGDENGMHISKTRQQRMQDEREEYMRKCEQNVSNNARNMSQARPSTCEPGEILPDYSARRGLVFGFGFQVGIYSGVFMIFMAFAVMLCYPKLFMRVVTHISDSCFNIFDLADSVLLIGWILYTVFMLKRYFRENKLDIKIYFWAIVGSYMFIRTLIDVLLHGFSFSYVFANSIAGVCYATLPMILVLFIVHLHGKRKRKSKEIFLTKMAVWISIYFPLNAFGMIVFGAVWLACAGACALIENITYRVDGAVEKYSEAVKMVHYVSRSFVILGLGVIALGVIARIKSGKKIPKKYLNGLEDLIDYLAFFDITNAITYGKVAYVKHNFKQFLKGKKSYDDVMEKYHVFDRE